MAIKKHRLFFSIDRIVLDLLLSQDTNDQHIRNSKNTTAKLLFRPSEKKVSQCRRGPEIIKIFKKHDIAIRKRS